MKSLLFLSLIIFACKKDDPATLTGTWQLNIIESWQANKLTAASPIFGVLYQFSDQQMFIKEDGITDTYAVKITDNKIDVDFGLTFTILQLDYCTLILSKTAYEIEMRYYFSR